MAKRRNREPGQVVRIPLGDGTVGWGRHLRDVMVEFYDRFDPEEDAEQVEPGEVVASDTAFTLAVMDRAFRKASSWEVGEVVPLSAEEESRVHRWFKQDPNGALTVAWTKPDGTWGEDDATREECEGLERQAVWDPEHIEDRLRDHRAGRPSKWAVSLALKD